MTKAKNRITELEKELQKLQREGEDGIETIRVLNDLSYILTGSDPEKAFDYAEKALELSRSIDNKEGQAGSYINMGISYFIRGNYEEALKNYIKSLEINEEIGTQVGIGNSNNNIGLVYLHTGEYEKALEYLYKSLENYKQTGEKFKIAITYNNLGVTLKNLERYDEAMEYNLKALEIYESIEQKHGIAMVYNNLGYIHSVRKEYEKALEYHQKGIEVSEQAGNKNWMAGCYLSAGSVYVELDQHEKALEYLKKGLILAKESQATEAELAVYAQLTQLYENIRNYKKALEYIKKHSELKSRIFNEENKERISRLKLKHESDKKAKEAEIFRLKNEELERMVSERTEELEKELTDRKRIEEELKDKLKLIEDQRAAILDLSTPVIKIWEGILVIPLIGLLDSKRAQHLTEELLTSVSSTLSRIAIIDITGVPTVDSAVANHLVKTVESVKLLGTRCIITGIRPEVAQTIIHLGIDITGLRTMATLAEGLRWAFKKPSCSNNRKGNRVS
ncbi:tetratricopeptide repeat protein [candidate division WOR-3 bacterium]|nr:tetratricopeptide repeat protein [candidate division WOR-3 bacterium]